MFLVYNAIVQEEGAALPGAVLLVPGLLVPALTVCLCISLCGQSSDFFPNILQLAKEIVGGFLISDPFHLSSKRKFAISFSSF